MEYATAQVCAWSFALLPAELNAGEDFSALWIQVEIDPKKGWCASDIYFDMRAPSDGRIVSAVPKRGGRVKKVHPATIELVVDAEGAAPIPGMVAQDVILPAGRTRVTHNEYRYVYRWTGKSRAKVVVAIGVQLSHRMLPPELLSVTGVGLGFGVSSCRPNAIREY